MTTSSYPHPILAREGWPFIALALLLAMGMQGWLGFWLALPFWLALVFVVQFFRDPPRAVPQQPGVVLSPADGRIVRVETVRDPYANRDALLASVKNSIGIVTALNPYIGYTASTRIAQEALISGRRVADLVIEAGLLDREELDRLLSPEHLANLRVSGEKPHATAVAEEV